MDNGCVSCGKEVATDHKAILCDLCESWEHVECMRMGDRPSEALYEAMVSCRSKALTFTCTDCRKKGSITKRLMTLDYDSARAENERLASARLLEEKEQMVATLTQELEKLRYEKDALHERLFQCLSAKVEPVSSATPRKDVASVEVKSKLETTSHTSDPVDDHTSSSSTSDDHESDDDREEDRSTLGRRGRGSSRNARGPHPQGFKEMRSRIQNFSGKRGEDDFQLWLEDYEEASNDCHWDDQDRARWFSWFITGPAKATWQRTLKKTDKSSWKTIVEVYKGQYGIHLDPRTAYQRCHELRYDQFGSAQGLLNAMRDYQRMAPHKLTDDALESILWNKVSVELQKEVKEITDGSVQELLQRLLRAEAVLAERQRRSRSTSVTVKPQTSNHERSQGQTGNGLTKCDSNRMTGRYRNTAEMVAKEIKCYKCEKKGHVARFCPNGKPQQDTQVRAVSTSSEREATGGSTKEPHKESSEQLWHWTRVLSMSNAEEQQFPVVGPAYKIDISVHGVKTRALLDHGSQVSIVRREVLPMVKEKQGWSMDTCVSKLLPLKAQPIGATGKELGAAGIVVLDIQVEATAKTCPVPCYVLDSDQPLWSGELTDCGVLMGTNALITHGFGVTQSDGKVIEPGNRRESVSTPETRTIHVVLSETVHLKPNQTKLVKSRVEETESIPPAVWMIGPNEELLAEKNCDMPETLFEGNIATMDIPLNNWGSSPIIMKKGSHIGVLEEVSVVSKSEKVWAEQPSEVVRVCQPNSQVAERLKELQAQLQVGKTWSKRERTQLTELLLKFQDVFALSDKELGETNVVSHSIDTGNAPPVKSTPRRLPYSLRKELEEEMDSLLKTGCIEPSVSPYSSPLVLVRKKTGGIRVCVDYRALNRDTVPDCYPIPRIDELVDIVGRRRATVFSALDLMKGYHQVQVEEDSKMKTAFTCHLGLYQYRRMPFGLTNAPATFQRLMGKLFGGKDWEFVFVYLDDILIASRDLQEHLEHLQKVAQRLRESGLRLKPAKCVFATEQVEYLGHTLTKEGVKPNKCNVQAVSEFPRPNSLKEVRSFLGMANFYRRHIPSMAAISRPLTDLTRYKASGRPVPFVWSEECQQAFDEIKRRLVTAPV